MERPYAGAYSGKNRPFERFDRLFDSSLGPFAQGSSTAFFEPRGNQVFLPLKTCRRDCDPPPMESRDYLAMLSDIQLPSRGLYGMGWIWVNNNGPASRNMSSAHRTATSSQLLLPEEAPCLRNIPDRTKSWAMRCNAFWTMARMRGNIMVLEWDPRPGASWTMIPES